MSFLVPSHLQLEFLVYKFFAKAVHVCCLRSAIRQSCCTEVASSTTALRHAVKMLGDKLDVRHSFDRCASAEDGQVGLL